MHFSQAETHAVVRKTGVNSALRLFSSAVRSHQKYGESSMSFRLGIGVLIASAFVAMAATPALACKGAESLLRDDFTEADPAWGITWPESSGFDIGSGKVVARSDAGTWASMWWNGSFFP